MSYRIFLLFLCSFWLNHQLKGQIISDTLAKTTVVNKVRFPDEKDKYNVIEITERMHSDNIEGLFSLLKNPTLYQESPSRCFNPHWTVEFQQKDGSLMLKMVICLECAQIEITDYITKREKSVFLTEKGVIFWAYFSIQNSNLLKFDEDTKESIIEKYKSY